MEGYLFSAAQTIYQAYYWMIIFYVISSWIPNLRESVVGKWVAKWVEPYLSVFRRFIPPIGMFDFSAIAAIIVYRLLGGFALSGVQTVLSYLF